MPTGSLSEADAGPGHSPDAVLIDHSIENIVYRALQGCGLRKPSSTRAICYPEASPIAAEGIGAGLDTLLFPSLQSAGSARVYELGPTAIFIALAPFVGSERACELANGAPVEVA